MALFKARSTTQRRVDHPKRTGGVDEAIALFEHEAYGLAFEFSREGTAFFGNQTPIFGDILA
ncbi:hypothetical protein ALP29_200910 [Pseudomonas syringae pv. avii]|uniref:Uncharacterized protein n=1 Tax=Pseudomonas syringae pv. avii TaxID=663959 RepID=A0A3M5VK56_PSESX|nr:hypothetical protein ALP29_200910 [Pseudomonas syringae pv. avii]